MSVLRFILLIPIYLIKFLGKILHWIIKAILFILRPIVGKVEWSVPFWVKPANKFLDKLTALIKKYVLWIWLIVILIVAGVIGYNYYEAWKNNKPKPIEIAPIEYVHANAKLYQPTKRNYHYTNDNASRYYFIIRFNESVAPATQSDNITEGINISPNVDGIWSWVNDKEIKFTPKNMWDIGKTYKISIEPEKLLVEHVVLKDKEYSFTTQDFSYTISKGELYQNPLDPNEKNVIFEVNFSDPVDVSTFEKNINMKLVANIPSDIPQKDHEAAKKRVLQNAKNYNFVTKYDDKKLNAWIRSESITLPEVESGMIIEIDKGVSSSLGGGKTLSMATRSQFVASVYTNVVRNALLTIAEQEDGTLQQTLVVNLMDKVNVEKFAPEVKAWVLPQNRPALANKSEIKNYRWSNNDDISYEILSKSEPLKLTTNSAEEENQNIVSFKYKSEPFKYIYVEIGKNIQTIGGYKAKYISRYVLQVPNYPKKLSFLSEGSLLSLKGEKKIPIVSRNIEGVELDIRRVVPSQIQHLITMNDNWRFSDMSFNYVGENHFIERFNVREVIDVKDPGRNNYDGLDISKYLYNKNGAKQGVFLVTLSNWNPKDNKTINYAMGGYRLLVVTDIGIISKLSNDGSADLFIQSINSGKPISMAKVSVLGMNGVEVATAYSDNSGHVKFGDLSKFTQEKTPVVYIVQKDGDFSFLPLSNYSNDRRLDFSRFNTGGLINTNKDGKIEGYLFSDRGIYRPGDTINVGSIVRAQNWDISVNGIPVVAKVYDARGELVKEIPFKLDKSGFNEISFSTTESSPTGNWQIYLSIANDYDDKKNGNYKYETIGTLSVVVKEFEPDRMNVKLELTPENISGWVKPNELNATIIAQNLFGTPAQDRRVSSKLFLTPTYFVFKNFQNFNFYDNRYLKNKFEMALEDVYTDENGSATLNLLLNEHERASYKLDILADVFEAGAGRSVVAEASVIVSPNEYLVGAKNDGDMGYIKKDTQRNLDIIAIDPKLNQIKLDNLTMEIIEQKYISVLTLQNSGVYKYQSKLKEIPISSDKFNIDAKGSKYTLNTKTPGVYILIIKNEIGDVLYKTNYNVVGEANIERSLERNAELGLKISKASYKNGEEIEIAIDTPYVGSGLITIEKDRVYAWKWFNTSTTSSTQRIKIPDDLKGNGYVNIQFVRDINSDEIFMSPLSYGVIPFKVENTKESAKVEITSSSLVKPGEDIHINVKTNSKQKVVVFAVDEGILQVANYKLTNPLNYFFRKKELAVSSYQILDLILPEFSKIMKLTSAAGGDSDEMSIEQSENKHLNPFKRKVDKPVVFWSGITEVDGEKTFTYNIPDYFNGKIRVMAVAVSDEKIGIAQTNSIVRDDFILTPNAPYMTVPNDEFEISVGVSNNLENLDGKKLPINVSLITSLHVKVLDNATKTITLGEKQEGFVKFRLKATEVLGGAELIFRANYEDKNLKKEYKTTRVATISNRPLVPFRVASTMGRMDGANQDVDNLRDMYEPFAIRDARVAHSPFIISRGLASYLSNYPHLCSEQLVSRAISSLINDKYVDVMGALNSDISHEYIFSILKTRQNSSGSIGLWRASSYNDAFVSVYSAHYILEAQDNGVAIPNSLLKNLNTFLNAYASDNYKNDMNNLRLRAYAVYLLTRQNIVTTNTLSSIQESLEKNYKESWRDDVVALYLASTYKILQMDKEADDILEKYWKNLRSAYKDAWWTNNYYDPLVVNASAIYFISKYFPQKVKNIPEQALENMIMMIRKDKYTTTSSSMSILAIDSYTNALNETANKADENLSIEAYSLQTNNEKKEELVKRLISGKNKILVSGNFSNDDTKIAFNNPSKIPAWYAVVEEGYDKLTPTKAVQKGLEIYREYTDENGKHVSSVKLGEKINVTIRVRSNSAEGVGNVAVVDLLPGGFEVVYKDTNKNNVGSEDDEDSETCHDCEYFSSPIAINGTSWYIDYNDVREDRVLIYGYVRKDISTFKYQIKSTNVGNYQIAPAYAEAMYDREIQAVSASQGNITVLPAQ